MKCAIKPPFDFLCELVTQDTRASSPNAQRVILDAECGKFLRGFYRPKCMREVMARRTFAFRVTGGGAETAVVRGVASCRLKSPFGACALKAFSIAKPLIENPEAAGRRQCERPQPSDDHSQKS